MSGQYAMSKSAELKSVIASMRRSIPELHGVMIASTDGLGYRIFLVRRYMAMDVILPYVAWITLLAWLMDLGLRQLARLCFPWYEGAKA